MNTQTIGQNGATAAQRSEGAEVLSGLLSDPLARALHDAFWMGSGLQELRGKILLESFQLPPSSQGSASNDAGSVMLKNIRAAQSLTAQILVDVEQVFTQDASHPIASSLLEDGIAVNGGANVSRISEWRALFTRLAIIHRRCFADVSIDDTPYIPAPQDKLKESFPYLYPTESSTPPPPDYALLDFPSDSNDSAGSATDDALKHFTLYDVTRRALNCLVILYTKPEESLIPDIIKEFQLNIVRAVPTFNQQGQSTQDASTASAAITQSEQGQGGTQSQQNGGNEVVLNTAQGLSELAADTEPQLGVGPAPAALSGAIKFLTLLTHRFLMNWDGFLRENFYTGGQIKNNDLELIAYEAGRSISTLAWNVSLQLAPLENGLSAPDNAAVAHLPTLQEVWNKAFDAPPVNLIERRLSALGPTLDEAFYRTHPDIQRPAPGERPHPALPSQAIHAITYSLVYWQRAVQWLSAPSTKPTPAPNSPLNASTGKGVAAVGTAQLNEPVGTPATSQTEQPLRAKEQLVGKLHLALVTQAGIWQSLMLGEQTLQSFAAEAVTQKILNNIMAELEQSAKERLLDVTQQPLQGLTRTALSIGIVLLVVLVGGTTALLLTGQAQSLATVFSLLIGSIVTLAGASYSRMNAFFTRPVDSPATGMGANGMDLTSRLSSLLGLAEGTVVSAFHEAYKQILAEFDDLNHSVAVTYPLIDIFIASALDLKQEGSLDEMIEDGYSFLTQVIWTDEDRKEEVDRIARAAFGPIGALLTPGQPRANAGKTVVS